MKHLKSTPNKSHSSLWPFLSADSSIHQWAQELKSAASKEFDQATWRMVGHGVVLIGDDAEEAMEVVHCVAREAKMAFHPIFVDEVASGFNDWINTIPEGPCIVFLEPGYWVGSGLVGDEDDLGFVRSPNHDEVEAFEFRRAFKQFVLAGAPNSPLVFVTVLKSHSHLDSNLRRAGCFDRRFSMPVLKVEEWAQLFINEMGRSMVDETITSNLLRLGTVIKSEWPNQRRRKLIEMGIQRVCHRENRKASFNDLIKFAALGLEESGEIHVTEDAKRLHAIHEAGHILISYLTSKEKMWPSYASIKTSGGNFGIVVTPYEAPEANMSDMTYSDAIYHLRISLAGRAAEHLILGAENVSASGSTSDLQKAVCHAGQLFGLWGHSLELGTDEAAGSNLSVIGSRASEWEQARVDVLIAPFLQKQFMHVLNLLKENRTMLEKVIGRLVEKGVMFQDDFLSIA